MQNTKILNVNLSRGKMEVHKGSDGRLKTLIITYQTHKKTDSRGGREESSSGEKKTPETQMFSCVATVCWIVYH